VTDYAAFLAAKQRRHGEYGRDCTADDVHPTLHDWQREIVAWAVRKGRAAIWADTGLGKTFMQIQWARLAAGPGERALIVAPLAVCQQTIREAAKLDINARYLREDDGQGGLIVTNYEMADRFDPTSIAAVVLDEASILKQSDGKTRTKLIQHFAPTRARLACTATPAPNDPEELTSQAEFLGVMPRVEMLAAYFVHDDKGWRLKGHARGPMFHWMTSWAVALRRPSDIGYDDTGYLLPPLNIVPQVVSVDLAPRDGELFRSDIGGVSGRAQVRRETLTARVQRAVELVKAEQDEPWLLWAGLNDEAEALAAGIPGAINVTGNWSPEDKAQALLDFADGKIRYLVTKPSIASMGMNFQHCARMAFVGLSDSWEAYYQSIRRCWRYGQTRQVDAHIVLSQLESQIAGNVARKEQQTSRMVDDLVRAMRAEWKADQ
jgi:helicase-like protein/SNF2 domain-containing protein